MPKPEQVVVISSKNYVRVIEIRAPLRLYWTENGFDGFEFEFNHSLTEHEQGLIAGIITNLRMVEADA